MLNGKELKHQANQPDTAPNIKEPPARAYMPKNIYIAFTSFDLKLILLWCGPKLTIYI